MALNRPSLLKQALKRIKSETPPFFKKANRFFMWLVASALAMYEIPVIANEGLLSVELMDWMQNAAGYLFAIGSIGVILTKLPTTDPDLSKQ